MINIVYIPLTNISRRLLINPGHRSITGINGGAKGYEKNIKLSLTAASWDLLIQLT